MLKFTILLGILSVFLLTTQTAFAEPKGSYQSENFKITNMSALYKGKYIQDIYELLGIIENTGNNTSMEIQLVATLFDKNNNLIGIDETSPIFEVSKNGSHSPFKFIVSTNKTLFDHYVVEVGGLSK